MPPNTITQFSTRAALERGDFQGGFSCGELAQHGTLGAGYAQALSATIILLNGTPYAADEMGKVRLAADGTRLTYGCAVPFVWDTSLNVSSRIDHQAVEALVDKAVPDRDLLCAVKIAGRFLDLDISNPSRQSAPQRGLSDILEGRPRIRVRDAKGTLVGFRSPDTLEHVRETGLTLFFLSSNLQTGGGVTGFTMQEGTIEIDACSRFHLVQPGATTVDKGIVVVPKR